MQQVLAKISMPLDKSFEYLFDAGSQSWLPILDTQGIQDREKDMTWVPVLGFEEKSFSMKDSLLLAFKEASPESGSYVLYSRRRRKAKGMPR
jgi:hypothetical protein